MNDTSLIKTYESYISELKEANATQEKVIQFQEKTIEKLEEIITQQEEKISLLMDQLDHTMDMAKKMAEIIDTFQN